MAALITFASPAAASVIMYAEHARMLLRCAGRDENDAQGIFTAEQLPAAIAALRAAAEAAKQRDAGAQFPYRDTPPCHPVPRSVRRAWFCPATQTYPLKTLPTVTFGTPLGTVGTAGGTPLGTVRAGWVSGGFVGEIAAR